MEVSFVEEIKASNIKNLFCHLIMNVTACMIRIIQTKGLWLIKPGHIVLLSCLLGLASLVRHNGILFVFSALLLLMLLYSSQLRRVMITALITILIVFTIKFPVSVLLNVEPHDNVKGEIIGIPMGIMGNALISDPEHILARRNGSRVPQMQPSKDGALNIRASCSIQVSAQVQASNRPLRKEASQRARQL